MSMNIYENLERSKIDAIAEELRKAETSDIDHWARILKLGEGGIAFFPFPIVRALMAAVIVELVEGGLDRTDGLWRDLTADDRERILRAYQAAER